jgi:IS5 family transposase
MNKKLKSRLGRVVRDIERQLPQNNQPLQQAFNLGLAQAKQLIAQQQNTKGKLYSLHAPETECISKGKAHKKYVVALKPVLLLPTKKALHSAQ